MCYLRMPSLRAWSGLISPVMAHTSKKSAGGKRTVGWKFFAYKTAGSQVSFDDLPANQRRSTAERRAFWEGSKRLAKGSLVALWFHRDNSDQPGIMFATVEHRDPEYLAPRDQAARPSIGIRYVADLTRDECLRQRTNLHQESYTQ